MLPGRENGGPPLRDGTTTRMQYDFGTSMVIGTLGLKVPDFKSALS
jgi:hypothetical protein